MTTLTGRSRRSAAAAAGLAMACALAVPAAAAHASAGNYTPNSHEWYFSKWGIQQDVWPASEGAGVTVAVVDSGVQGTNPDLRGVVKPGGDMLGRGGGETDRAPNGGHGTAAAELIAGQGIGSGPVGVAPVGVSPQAKILPVQVAGPTTDIQSSLPEGIKYAVDHGVGVINISLGEAVSSPADCDPSLQQAIGYALAHNVVVVAASGDVNKGGPGPVEPATCAGVLAVGGVEPSGSLWPDSVQGPNVSVAAPGDHIYTSNNTGQLYSIDGSGTSWSAPLVSAAAALIRSAYPSMPWYTVDQRLINTAMPVGKVPNNGTGYGIIDINKALHVSQYPVSASAPNPPYARYQAWLKGSGQSGSSGTQPGSSSTETTPGGIPGYLIILVALVLIVAIVMTIVLVSRNRRRPASAGPAYSPNAYTPPPGQYQGQSSQGHYPQPGQAQYPAQGQQPQPGSYAPPGQYPPPGQQYPQAQHPAQPGQGQEYPPPGQYPPPRQ